MSNETQTQSKTEYEVGTEFIFNAEPTAPNIVLEGLSRAVEAAKLETRMFVYDALHRTNYRAIRHRIVADERNRRFEESIGLERTTSKSQ